VNVIPNCPLCQSAQIKFLFIKQQCSYHICTVCRFIFGRSAQNPNFTNTLADFEPAYLNYLSLQQHDNRNHHALLKKLSRFIHPGSSRILDIGCGSGKLTRFLREQGYKAIGLEPSQALYREFLQGDDHFFNGTADNYLLAHPGQEFDLVILADVLEHVEEPMLFMETVSRLLAPGGTLFISTPDSRSFFARATGRRWHYFNRYHLSLFSKENLRQLAASHGLHREAGGHMARQHSFYYIIKYLFNFVLGKNAKVPDFTARFHLPVNLLDMQYGLFRKSQEIDLPHVSI
jgi:2-polyprenyl-3-methyl-5-hydroxy-6-metoxy-1,4-benzoquinol methylase